MVLAATLAGTALGDGPVPSPCTPDRDAARTLFARAGAEGEALTFRRVELRLEPGGAPPPSDRPPAPHAEDEARVTLSRDVFRSTYREPTVRLGAPAAALELGALHCIAYRGDQIALLLVNAGAALDARPMTLELATADRRRRFSGTLPPIAAGAGQALLLRADAPFAPEGDGKVHVTVTVGR